MNVITDWQAAVLAKPWSNVTWPVLASSDPIPSPDGPSLAAVSGSSRSPPGNVNEYSDIARSRRRSRRTTESATDALQMATWRRRPEPGTVVHSDRGAQGGFN